MSKRRIFLSLSCIFVSISFLMGRLLWIQVIDSHEFSAKEVDLVQHSVNQRAQMITLDEGRGNFYDRHKQLITGEVIHSLAVFPLKDQLDDKSMKLLIHILGTTMEDWQQFMRELKEPRLWTPIGKKNPVHLSSKQIKSITSLNLRGIYVVPYRIRYNEPFLFSQLIGFVGQNPQLIHERYQEKLNSGQMTEISRVGASGLEKTMDPLLQSLGTTKLSLFSDGRGKPISGLSARLQRDTNSFYPLKVVTTLDKDIQQKVESVLDRMHMKKGAVVVLDANNADVISMASRPQFNPYQVALLQGNWSNKALKATTPGSIFKTVIAAAALEEGLVKPNEVFYCDGLLGKYHFSCWKDGGHGSITFEQAFTQSCNITFAKVVERLPSDLVGYYAKGLGLIQQVGWSVDHLMLMEKFTQFDSEEKGKIFAGTTPMNDGGVRAQISIGQRDVMMTPLQAANLIVTLLHNGEVRSPRVVSEVRYQNNGLMSSFNSKALVSKRSSIISRKTSKTLLSWMEKVVHEGTGQSLKQAHWSLAGKSGTAQVKLNGADGLNQWFIGYGPTENPRYAVAVLVQTGDKENKQQATAIFKEIMDELQAS